MSYHFIFDMDGTLIDTEFEVSKITQQIVADKGFDVAPEIVHQLFSGYPSREKFQGTAGLLGGRIAEEDIPQMSARHEDMKKALYKKEHVPLVRGIPELLAHLNLRADFLSVATSASKETADIAIEKAGLTKFFNGRVFGSDSSPSGKKKPAPDVYLHAMAVFSEALPGLTVETIAIEDSVAGVAAAKAAGIGVIIGYVDPYFGGAEAAIKRTQDMKSAGATAILRDFSDIPSFLASVSQNVSPAGLKQAAPKKKDKNIPLG
jgi:HAD superfamily hydrolase (TIGR01509 family)